EGKDVTVDKYRDADPKARGDLDVPRFARAAHILDVAESGLAVFQAEPRLELRLLVHLKLKRELQELSPRGRCDVGKIVLEEARKILLAEHLATRACPDFVLL